jgi:hypothetical protein
MMLSQLSGLDQFLVVAHNAPVAPPRSEVLFVSLLSLDVPLALPRMQWYSFRSFGPRVETRCRLL